MSSYTYTSFNDLLKEDPPLPNTSSSVPKTEPESTSCFTFFKDLLKEDPPFPKFHSCQAKTKPEPSSCLTFFDDLLKQEPPLSNSHSCQAKTKPESSTSCLTFFKDLLKDQPPLDDKVGEREKCVVRWEDVCVYSNTRRGVKMFPPPISSLRSNNGGTPFVYYKFDNNLGRFVEEEINIRPRGFMHVSRANGRLVMKSSR